MNNLENLQSIYKSSLPFYFYGFRVILLAGIIFLYFIKVDYLLILAYSIFAFILTLNRDKKIIEVWNDHFNIITPSFYGNKFATTKTYYYKKINNFEFEKGYYDMNSAIIGMIVSLFLRANTGSAYKKPKISFADEKQKKITIELSFSQDSLFKAIEIIETKIVSKRTTTEKKC